MGILWNRTVLGGHDVQACHLPWGPAKGDARRRCFMQEGFDTPRWEMPDFSECAYDEIYNIRKQVNLRLSLCLSNACNCFSVIISNLFLKQTLTPLMFPLLIGSSVGPRLSINNSRGCLAFASTLYRRTAWCSSPGRGQPYHGDSS